MPTPASLLMIAVPALVAAAAVPANAAEAPVAGVVRDAETGRPLADVFVQQVDGLRATFSGPDGRFTLALDADGARALAFTLAGRRALVVPAPGPGAAPLEIRLARLSAGAVATAPAAAAPAAGPDERPFGSQVMLALGGLMTRQADGAAVLAGTSLADLRGRARLRTGGWLLEGDGGHWRTPVDVAGLDRSLNPAFTPSTWDAGARAAWVAPLATGLEAALGAGYRYRNTVPNNGDVPYTGNGTDFEQTRHALGPALGLAWRPAPRWALEVNGAWYPQVVAWAKAPGRPFAAGQGLVGDASLAYELAPGLRLGLRYQAEDWRGEGQARADALAVQVQIVPPAQAGSPAPEGGRR